MDPRLLVLRLLIYKVLPRAVKLELATPRFLQIYDIGFHQL